MNPYGAKIKRSEGEVLEAAEYLECTGQRLTVSGLARELGVTRATVYNYMKGKCVREYVMELKDRKGVEDS